MFICIKTKNALMCAIALLFSCVVIAMDQQPVIYLSGNDKKDLIKVPLDIAQQSQTIVNLLADMGGYVPGPDTPIPMAQFTADTIKLVFGTILPLYNTPDKSAGRIQEILASLPLDTFINTVNCLDYVHVADDLLDMCKDALLGIVVKMSIAEIATKDRLNSINPALLTSCVNKVMCCLKTKIMSNPIVANLYNNSNGYTISRLVFSPDGTKIAFIGHEEMVSFDEPVRQKLILCDMNNVGSTREIDLPFNAVGMLVKFSPDSTKICVGSYDHQDNVIVYDINTNEVKTLSGHQGGRVTVIEFSADGTKIVSGSYSSSDNLFVWDVATGGLIKKIDGLGKISIARFSPSGTDVIAGDDRSSLVIYNVINDNKIQLSGHRDEVAIVEFSGDGSKVVSASRDLDGDLIVWDAHTGEQIKKLIGHAGRIIIVQFLHNSATFVSASNNNKNKGSNLILWDAMTGHKIVFNGQQEYVSCMALSPDGSKIVAGGSGKGNNLVVYKANTGELLKVLDGHEKSVNLIAFRASGPEFISSSLDSLIIWNSASLGEVIKIDGSHKEVAYGPDGNSIVFVNSKNNVISLILMTDKQREGLSLINKQYSPQQIMLLYILCNAQTLGEREVQELKKFSPFIQGILLR